MFLSAVSGLDWATCRDAARRAHPRRGRPGDQGRRHVLRRRAPRAHPVDLRRRAGGGHPPAGAVRAGQQHRSRCGSRSPSSSATRSPTSRSARSTGSATSCTSSVPSPSPRQSPTSSDGIPSPEQRRHADANRPRDRTSARMARWRPSGCCSRAGPSLATSSRSCRSRSRRGQRDTRSCSPLASPARHCCGRPLPRQSGLERLDTAAIVYVLVHQYIPPRSAAATLRRRDHPRRIGNHPRGSLLFGVPLLLLPEGADQYANAERIVAAGAGLQLLKETCPSTPYATVCGPCSDGPNYRCAAEKIQTEIHDMPDVSDAIERIEALARVEPFGDRRRHRVHQPGTPRSGRG